MIVGAASGIVLGLLLATAYGAAFHFIFGGPARRIVLYILASWFGFIGGHLAGFWLDISLFQLGAVHLFSASVGAWITLLVGHWLGVVNPRLQEQADPPGS